MGDPAMMHEDCVWVVFGTDSGPCAIGVSAVAAWRDFFDRTAATIDDLSQTLGHEDFRCVACRLVPIDADEVWSIMATTVVGGVVDDVDG